MKHFYKLATALCLFALMPFAAQAQLELKPTTLPNSENEPAPVHPVPSPRQLKWQYTEFYAFFHYGMNTYTGDEWGHGNESENIFAPTAAPNPEQWLTAVKAAGMKGGIAVVKHHDGFCLWPTKTTTHSVTSSSNEFAKQTDIPRDFAKAAQKLGMKYGFYVSPWDRNNAEYGKNTYVKNVFLRQCAELAAYGADQFEMWFDGANGGNGYYGGAGGTRNIDRSTYYDVPNLRDTVHKVSPDCVLWGVGGEARWIGNEEGWAGETNWSPEEYGYSAESNGMYGTMNGWYWQPGESDAKYTSGGWFWHSGEKVMGNERLFQMYLETVGRNSTLILNCPPDKSGSLPTATVEGLKEFGTTLKKRLGGTNYALTADDVQASEERTAGQGRSFSIANAMDGDSLTYWATNDGTLSGTITFHWKTAQPIRYVMLQEHIKLGQRVKAFTIETSNDGVNWNKRGGNIKTTTIGYKRIIPLNGSTSDSYSNAQSVKYLRVRITDSRACPTLENIALY